MHATEYRLVREEEKERDLEVEEEQPDIEVELAQVQLFVPYNDIQVKPQSVGKITDAIITERMERDAEIDSKTVVLIWTEPARKSKSVPTAKIWEGQREKNDADRQIKITKGQPLTTVNKSQSYSSIWPPEREEVTPAEVTALRSELTAYLDQRQSSSSTKSARSSKVDEQYHSE